MRRSLSLLSLLASLLILSGCGAALRLGVGPCVDTDGNPGFDVTLTWGLGFGASGGALLATGTMGGGMSGEPLTGSLVTGLSAELLYVSPDADFGVQGGLLFSTRTLFREENEGHFGFGANVGGGWVFEGDQGRSRRLIPFIGRRRSRATRAIMLGVLAQGEVLWLRGEAIGYFTFPVFLQFLTTT